MSTINLSEPSLSFKSFITFLAGLEVTITDATEAILLTNSDGDVIEPVTLVREEITKKKNLTAAVFPAIEIIGWYNFIVSKYPIILTLFFHIGIRLVKPFQRCIQLFIRQ